MVASADRLARAGDLVNVYDKGGALLGRGLFNPKSQIAVRMLSWGRATVDDTWWRGKIEEAVELRRRTIREAETDAYRLIHAEGDGLSGLIVERYADNLVFELFSLGMYERRWMLSEMLAMALGKPTRMDRPDRVSAKWRVHYRADREIQRLEGFHVDEHRAGAAASRSSNRSGESTSDAGDEEGEIAATSEEGVARTDRVEDGATATTIVEHGLRYRVDFGAGQKTGFFCDQRENRRRFAGMCEGATVLDVCCYTGGFGLCAKKLGGASEVTAVDLDEAAVATAHANANLNQERIDVVHSDAFIYMRQMIAIRRRFDAVVLDPPKLATSREAVPEAMRKYNDLNMLAMQCTKPGGVLLTCSCSGLVSRDDFMNTVHVAGRRAARTLQVFHFSGAGPDHPIMTNCPESGYLKAAWLRVM